MVEAIMSNEMIDLLKSLIGSKFVSYDIEKEPSFSRVYGNLRLNTTKCSIEILNDEKEYPFIEGFEDMTSFSCRKVDGTIPFEPAIITDSQTISVDKMISSIDVISDIINVNHCEYQIKFDVAIIIYMGNEVLMLARDTWFSELITVVPNDDYDQVYSIDEVKEAWSNDDEYDVDVHRERIKLNI